MTRKEKAAIVLDRLRRAIPAPETELRYRTEFELLVAVILSAQCTDKRVNLVTPALFEAYPDATAMAEAEADEIVPFIRSVSYPNNKAKALAATARMLRDEHGGEVPREHAALVKLAGVGRKTANVVVAVAFGEAAIAVDTHVFRVANRVGLVRDQPTPLAVETGLRRVIPRDDWGEAHHLLILHGRYTCQARAPQCERCPLTDVCDYFAALQRLPDPLPDLDPKRGRYYSKTARRYFDEPATKTDRTGTEQIADPWTGSMNVFDARTGRTTKKVKDYRIG
ncbi:endonuclease III [Rubrivirga sp.]|uniref:endonuclease III n=1 Tax=Rubrivirga sp. TaxID=1885344 RepID=UPI003B524514